MYTGFHQRIACECEASWMQRARFLPPGFLDQHITGGRRWRGSFHTRTPELQMSELVENGNTTVVGSLGTDGGNTRGVDNLWEDPGTCE